MFCLYLIKVAGLRDAPHVAQWLDWEYLRERARVQALVVTFPPYFPFFFFPLLLYLGLGLSPELLTTALCFPLCTPFTYLNFLLLFTYFI
jgi:hypothetical protein